MMLKFVPGLLMLGFALPASAATLDGDTIDVTYKLTGSSTSMFYNSYKVPTGTIVLPIDLTGHGSISGNAVDYTFGQTVDFGTFGVASLTFTDTNTAKTITGVSFGNATTPSLTQNMLSYTSDSFTISFADVTAYKGDVIDIVAGVTGGGVGAVPLPASAPLFGAALMLVGAVGWGMRRKGASATA